MDTPTLAQAKEAQLLVEHLNRFPQASWRQQPANMIMLYENRMATARGVIEEYEKANGPVPA
jgi:hypothetical protein